ncbi:adenylate/guanylate cyclase domain-containing protein [Aquimarina sp. MMG016]|uniref:adenylate/guanylate cyclase domain-containing protein n=1 Tax=Aquimarina sp. MMG016 TaxID=2822690 RepID=UPI001B3A7010|nr:adenylate/guanylate cyclase domain-containing protein [Aquimarina sp. MMG016]
MKAQQDFFSYETKNQKFFSTGDSEYLDQYLTFLDSTRFQLSKVDFSDEKDLAYRVDTLENHITEIDSVFLFVITQIQARGYKDYNLEGSMRKDVHWLEKIDEISKEDILSLRRNEKDYIIRNEQVYVTKLTKLVNTIRKDIKTDKSIARSRKRRILYYLNGYHRKFLQLAELDQSIGIKDNSGLKQQLDKRITVAEADFSTIVSLTKLWEKKEFDRLTLYFIIITIVLIVVSILISNYISRKITEPLTELTRHITHFVDSKFTLETEHPVVRTDDEVGRLTLNFSFLKDEVISRLKFFKQKVDERTAELANANKKLFCLSEANSRFVPKEFLNNLGRDSIEQVKLGDQVAREMTIVFSDIREFTKISEALSPQENFDFINAYLSGIVPIIRRNGGFIDKFIGDSVMALFPKAPDQAIQTVFEFEDFLEEFNKELKKNNKPQIQIGTGIHTGKLILGTIGHAQRLETTVISDAVNTSSRIEGLTKYYQAKTIATEATVSKIEDKGLFKYRFLDQVNVKGKSKTLSVYEFLSSKETKKIESLQAYNKGIEFIKDKKIIEAASVFSDLYKKYPKDMAIQIFYQKCQNFVDKKTETWNDITQMITK